MKQDMRYGLRGTWTNRQVIKPADNIYTRHILKGGLSNSSYWPFFSRLAEDGCQSSKPEFRAGESSWDDRDRGHSGRHQQARPRHADAHGQMERDSYSRQGSPT